MLNRFDIDSHKFPQYASWSGLLAMAVFKPYEVAIVGDDFARKNRQMRRGYFPLAIYLGGVQENLSLLENKIVSGKTLIYVCRDRVCKLPAIDVEAAIRQIRFSD